MAADIPAGMCVVVRLNYDQSARDGWADRTGKPCNDERVRGSWYCARHKAAYELICE